MLNTASHRRLVIGLLLSALALTVVWVLVYMPSVPLEIRQQRGDAQLLFRVDRSRVWLNNECIYVNWETSGIDKIFIYDEPTVGVGEYTTCSFTEHVPSFEITFQDGQVQPYFLNIAQMYRQIDHWLVILGGVVCLWLAWNIAQRTAPISTSFFLQTVGQAVGVVLLTMLLWQGVSTSLAFSDVVVPEASLRERIASSQVVGPGLRIAALTPPDAVILVPLGVASPSSLHAIAYPRLFLYTGRTQQYFETYFGDGSLLPLENAQANAERLNLDAVNFDNLYLLLNLGLHEAFVASHGETFIAETLPVEETSLILLRMTVDAPQTELSAMIAALQTEMINSVNEEE